MPLSLIKSLIEPRKIESPTLEISTSPLENLISYRTVSCPPFLRSLSSSSGETLSPPCESPTVVKSCKHCSFSFRRDERQQDNLEFCSKGNTHFSTLFLSGHFPSSSSIGPLITWAKQSNMNFFCNIPQIAVFATPGSSHHRSPLLQRLTSRPLLRYQMRRRPLWSRLTPARRWNSTTQKLNATLTRVTVIRRPGVCLIQKGKRSLCRPTRHHVTTKTRRK